MVTIGVDPHKQTHTAAAVDQLGVELGHRTVPARPVGNGELLEWARGLDSERVWAVEDVRNVSGSLERFLIDRGDALGGRCCRCFGVLPQPRWPGVGGHVLGCSACFEEHVRR
jgi:hypothetical protein